MMTEDEFDALMRSRSFGTRDAINAEAKMLRGTTLLSTLGVALWGRTEGDLARQLLKPHPELPPGFALPDFLELLHVCEQIVSALSATREMSGLAHLTPRTISVGTDSWTVEEARCELVRRSIDYLENH
jgi:hypothetical protein